MPDLLLELLDDAGLDRDPVPVRTGLDDMPGFPAQSDDGVAQLSARIGRAQAGKGEISHRHRWFRGKLEALEEQGTGNPGMGVARGELAVKLGGVTEDIRVQRNRE